MASGKVARRTVVSDVAAILNSPELAALIVELDESGDSRGRKGYGAKALLGACLVKSLFALPTWTFAAALIAEHPGLQEALGGCPSVWACYRFSTKLRANRPALNACLDACAASIRAQNPDFGRAVAIDASDLPAFANGQRYVYNGGPERERFSDPDSSWGHRSAISTRAAGSFYGFKIHAAVCVATGLPIAWRIETGKRQESLYVAPLLDAVHARGIRPETCAMDKGYDNARVYAECEARDVEPVIPLRGAKKNQPALPLAIGGRLFPRIPRHTQRFRDLYRGRGAVEREFGRLKHDYGLGPLRVRGQARVQLHADLTILARLSNALMRTRQAGEPQLRAALA
jgi:Transposase DDE domain